MRPSYRFVLHLLVVIALLTALQLSVGVIAPVNSPYISALSTVTTGGEVFAAGCGFRTCKFRGERPFCSSTTEFTKCAQHGHECIVSPC